MKCVAPQLLRQIKERKQNMETPSELHNYVVVAFLSWAAGDMQQCVTLTGQVCQQTWTRTENKWVRNSETQKSVLFVVFFQDYWLRKCQ